MFGLGRNRPDALFVSGDMLCAGALAELDEMGFRIPDDVAVATISSQSLMAHPLLRVSVVPVPTMELGREAARVALELIGDPGHAPIQKVVPCEELQPGREMSAGALTGSSAKGADRGSASTPD